MLFRSRLIYTVIVLVLATYGIAAQANDEGEEVDRIRLGRLSEGPAILGGGVVVGDPTGFTAKLWFTETGFGIAGSAAWKLNENSEFNIQLDGIFHLALIETEGGRYIVPYVGAGVTNELSDDPRIGLRFPVGLSLLPIRAIPLEFFADIAPGVGLLPETDADLEFGIGVRFYLPL